MAALSPLTRREFTQYIAFAYAEFEADIRERHGADAKIQPLDRSYAFMTGRDLVEHGRYVPRTNARAMDYTVFAREARKQLPYARRLVAMDRAR